MNEPATSVRNHCLSPARARVAIDGPLGSASYARMFPELPSFQADEQFLLALGRAGGLILDPFMIHELFPSLTETASGSHPCCVVSVTYDRTQCFHGDASGVKDRFLWRTIECELCFLCRENRAGSETSMSWSRKGTRLRPTS